MHGYGFSERYYDAMRRRRSWSMNGRQGLQGYSAFLSGFNDAGSLVGAGVAAYEADEGADVRRAVFIGVTTGALTFLVNHFLGRLLK